MRGKSSLIVVIGSINMDLVCRTSRLPGAGETVLGEQLLEIPGGKGANQAVAAARLGGDVYMVSRVGDDDFGRRLLAGLRQNGVNTRYVKRTPDVASGCAMIVVDRRGENCIVVAPGANAHVTPADVDAAQSLIRRAAAVVMQLEIPLETVRHAVAMCRRFGIPSILDPAPVPPRGLARDLFKVDVLTPNEHEARHLVGGRGEIDAHAQTLIARGAKKVVLKLGDKGALLGSREEGIRRVTAFKVNAVDTTAAGDAFTGALAVALSEGRFWSDAIRFANAAGAVCCTCTGAQPSLPHRAAVERLLLR